MKTNELFMNAILNFLHEKWNKTNTKDLASPALQFYHNTCLIWQLIWLVIILTEDISAPKCSKHFVILCLALKIGEKFAFLRILILKGESFQFAFLSSCFAKQVLPKRRINLLQLKEFVLYFLKIRSALHIPPPLRYQNNL